MSVPDWVITLVGSVAAVCTTAAFVPQLIRVWRLKRAEEISLTTFSAFAVGTGIWLVYGLFLDSLPIVVANGVTLAIAATIVALKVRYDRATESPTRSP